MFGSNPVDKPPVTEINLDGERGQIKTPGVGWNHHTDTINFTVKNLQVESSQSDQYCQISLRFVTPWISLSSHNQSKSHLARYLEIKAVRLGRSCTRGDEITLDPSLC